MTGQAFIALLPELIATGFLILVLMAGVFSDNNAGVAAGLASLGTLAVFGSAAVLLAGVTMLLPAIGFAKTGP